MGYAEMAAEREAKGRVRKLTVDFMKWEKEDQRIIGKYISDNTITSKTNEGKYKQYVFHTDSGMVKFHCGSMFDNEQGAAMQRGWVYEITFKGKKPLPGGNSVNLFDLIEIGPSTPQSSNGTTPKELDLQPMAHDPTD